jgi:hypothetical protein
MKSNRCLLLFLFVLLCAAAACKKKSLNTAAIKIATIDYSHDGQLQHYSIFYGAYNSVDSVGITGAGSAAGHNGFNVFHYIGSSYTITNETNNVTTVYANTAGVILDVMNTSDSLSFIYSGNQLAQLYDWSYATNSLLSTAQYTWTNGDVSAIYTGSSTQTYDYNTGKPGQIGDPTRVRQFIAVGLPYTKTSHLPTDMYVNGTWQEKYYYTFDGEGRISQLQLVTNTAPTTDTAVYQYTYY